MGSRGTVLKSPSRHASKFALGLLPFLVAAVPIPFIATASPALECAGDFSGDGVVTVDELVTAVRNALYGCSAVATPSPTPTSPPSPTATPTLEIPLTANELLVWLRAGNYRDWPAESGPHASAGPHFGAVRTFLNPLVFASLDAGRAAHPAGSALVKGVYGSGDEVQGWSVMVKVQDDSDGGAGWYWLEHFRGSTFAASRGSPVCTGCHSLGDDFVRTRFPLQ